MQAPQSKRAAERSIDWGCLGPEARGSGDTDAATISAPRAVSGTRAAGGLPHPRFCLQCSPPERQPD